MRPNQLFRVGIVALVLVLTGADLVSEPIKRNVAALHLGRALFASNETLEQRLAHFSEARRWERKLLTPSRSITIRAQVESQELEWAADFLRTDPTYSGYILGKQLLQNPSFTAGTKGWFQYNSQWLVNDDCRSSSAYCILTYDRMGTGHGSLSQSLLLKSGRCYLMAVSGSVVRRDETPSFWLYFESYKADGRPSGITIEKSSGDQPWSRRAGIFCVPNHPQEVQQITVAPINVYGDALVQLGGARLYVLELPSK